MKEIKVAATDWQGNVLPEKPMVKTQVFKFVAITERAWGGGDDEKSSVLRMERAHVEPISHYIVYESNEENMNGMGGILSLYPPDGGFLGETDPMEKVTERRYRDGKLVAQGPFGKVDWPKCTPKR